MTISQCKKLLRALLLQGFLLLVTIASIDAIAFIALPSDVSAALPGYRYGSWVPDVFGRRYPHDYFIASEERGFDIKPTTDRRADQRHFVENISYPVWSNELGCFDRPHRELQGSFLYFAGDSYTWGYAPYESKFGTIFERLKGVDVLKCGVTHTGQRHQFSKFLEIGRKIGRWPEKVVVFYAANDVANDYAHPHTTVIGGRQVDNTKLDAANEIVRLGEDWFDQMRARIADARRALEADRPWKAPSRFLMQYSLTAQIVNGTLHALNERLQSLHVNLPVIGDPPVHWSDRYDVYKGRRLFDIHRLAYLQSRNGVYRYESYKYAEANKQALAEWSRHAKASGYALEVVLLPPGDVLLPEGEEAGDRFYSELTAVLRGLEIKFYDLAKELRKRKIAWDDIYWPNDPHFSSEGNVIIGKILAEIL